MGLPFRLRCRLGLAWLGTLPPAALIAVLIIRNAPGVLFMDDWDLVGATLIRGNSGQLGLEYLIAQHNESRPLFPRLLFLAIGTATQGDTRWLLLLGFSLACLVSYSVFSLARTTRSAQLSHLWGLTLLANLLVFTPKQAETWLWCSYLGLEPIVCLIGSLALLHSGLGVGKRITISAALCTVATFSYANGLLAWLLAAPVVIGVVGRRWLGWWALGFLLNAGLYFHGYVRPLQGPPLLDGLQFLRLGHYVLAFLGAPLGLNRLAVATAVGVFLMVLFALVGLYSLVNARDEDLRRRVMPWLSIGGYAVASGIAAGVGRSHFGVRHALANRYIPFSLYLALALLVVVPTVLQHAQAKGRLGLTQRRIAKMVLATGFMTCFALHAASAVIGVGELVRAGRMLRYGKSCLLLMSIRPDDRCLSDWVYPNTTALRQYAKALDQLGYLEPGLVRSPRLQDIRPPGPAVRDVGVFERLSEKPARFVAEGWAGLPTAAGPGDAIILAAREPNGDWLPVGLVPVLLPRPDIARARGGAYLNSGWRGDLVKRDLGRGRPLQISAWAFDTRRAWALPLDGVFTVVLPIRK